LKLLFLRVLGAGSSITPVITYQNTQWHHPEKCISTFHHLKSLKYQPYYKYKYCFSVPRDFLSIRICSKIFPFLPSETGVQKDTIYRFIALTTVISDWTAHSWLVNWSTAFYLQCTFLHNTCCPVTDAVAEFTWLTWISWYLQINQCTFVVSVSGLNNNVSMSRLNNFK